MGFPTCTIRSFCTPWPKKMEALRFSKPREQHPTTEHHTPEHQKVRSFTITTDRACNLATMTVALIFVSWGEHRLVLWMTTSTARRDAQTWPRRSFLSKCHIVSSYMHKCVLHWRPQGTCGLTCVHFYETRKESRAVCADRLQWNSVKIRQQIRQAFCFVLNTDCRHRTRSVQYIFVSESCEEMFRYRIKLRRFGPNFIHGHV